MAYLERKRVYSKRRRLDERYYMGLMAEMFGLETGQWKLDKITTIRLAKCFIKLKRVLRNKQQPYPTLDLTDYRKYMLTEDDEDCQSKVLGGFIAVLATDFTVLFVTNAVRIYTGFSPVEMIGRNLFDYIHKDDFPRILTALDQLYHFDCDKYKSRKRINVRMVKKMSRRKSKYIALDNMTFQILLSLEKAGEEMGTDSISQSLLDFNSIDMKGKSLYQFCHPEDLSSLTEAHFEVMRTGCMRITYRILDDLGHSVWLHTVAQPSRSCGLFIIAVSEVLWFD